MKVIGELVKTKVDKIFNEGDEEEIMIPKNTEGTICEIYDEYKTVLVEIWGDNAPKDVNGVFLYSFDEIE